MILHKVCILTTVHPAFDTRIFHKEAKTLVRQGYRVVLIVQHDKKEMVDGVHIVSLPKPRDRFERMFKLTWKILLLGVKEKAAVYHFHDPELIPVGVILAMLGKSVIYDVHEDVPGQILNKPWIKGMFLRKTVSFLVFIFERIGILFFTKVIAATDDIALKFPQKKVIALRNYPILEVTSKIPTLKYSKIKPIIIYTGGLTEIRGVKEIITAMGIVGDRAELWLLGKWESKQFELSCQGLEGWNNTKYFGNRPFGEHLSYTKIADIGLVNFLPVANHVNAMPNKPFEYMSCQVPIIMSNFSLWQEMFSECALFVDPKDSKNIAEKIIYLLNNPDIAKQLGQRGLELVEEDYSWEAESQKLLSLYDDIIK